MSAPSATRDILAVLDMASLDSDHPPGARRLFSSEAVGIRALQRLVAVAQSGAADAERLWSEHRDRQDYGEDLAAAQRKLDGARDRLGAAYVEAKRVAEMWGAL